MSLFQRIKPGSLPDEINPQNTIEVINEKVLQTSLLINGLLGTLFLVSGLLISINNGSLLIGISAIFVFAVSIILVFYRDLSRNIRSVGLLSMLYLAGVSGLLFFGATGIDIPFFIAIVVCAMFISTLRTSIYVGALSVFTHLILGIFISYLPESGSLLNTYLQTTGGAYWALTSFVMLIINALILLIIYRYKNDLTQQILEHSRKMDSVFVEKQLQKEKIVQQEELLDIKIKNMEFLSLMVREFNQISTLANLYDFSVDKLQKALNLYHIGIFILSSNQRKISLVAASGESRDEMLRQYQDMNLHEVGVLEETFHHQETRIAINRGGQSINFLLPESLSEIAIPLRSRNQIIGILSIHQNDLDAFTQDNIIQFQIIAEQLSSSIEKLQFFEENQQNIFEIEKGYREFTERSWREYMVAARKSHSIRFVGGSFTEAESGLDDEVLAIQTTGLPVFIRETQQGDKNQNNAKLLIPIKIRNAVLGAMKVDFNSSQISGNVQQLIENISERLSISIENARLLEEVQMRSARDHLITTVSSKVRASTDIDGILRSTAEEIGNAFGLSKVIVQLTKNSEINTEN
ncbi:MAG: GAF domain-containing protein [Anaerolineaceae bacterium]|nr:GAF domain-containing protein [Anaerolineaceae bacterium]